MCRSLVLLLSLFLAFFWAPSLAHALRGGSTLQATPNWSFGCEAAPIFDPITGAPILVATGQTTCTLRNLGYINNVFQLGSFVPGNGRITRIRVRSGANPAPLQVTIFQGSPGLCCTARRLGRVFQPVANGITTVRMNIRVFRSLDTSGGQLTQVTDAVGLTAVGPGSLPLVDQGTAGTFTSGTGLTQLWYPATAIGDPRVEGASVVDGLELLLEWTFRPNRGR